jgi:transposase
MKTTRKRYSADFKAKAALETIRGDLTLAELATKHGVHPTMIAAWKRQAIDGKASTFSGAGHIARVGGQSSVPCSGIAASATSSLAAAARRVRGPGWRRPVMTAIDHETLVAMLAKAHGDGTLDKQLTQLARPKLLIIDELGYLPFEANAARLFF